MVKSTPRRCVFKEASETGRLRCFGAAACEQSSGLMQIKVTGGLPTMVLHARRVKTYCQYFRLSICKHVAFQHRTVAAPTRSQCSAPDGMVRPESSPLCPGGARGRKCRRRASRANHGNRWTSLTYLDCRCNGKSGLEMLVFHTLDFELAGRGRLE